MAQQKGIIFYPERVAVAKGLLDDAEIGRLFLAVCDYAESGAIPDYPSRAWGVCFDLMREAIDKNAQKYAETCARNKKNIEKRWKNQASTNENDGIPSDTTVYDGTMSNTTHTNQTGPNLTEPNYSSVGSLSDTTEYDGIPQDTKGKRSAKRFTPPTVDDVRAYCEERGNRVDAQHFVDFYTANGWKVGRNSMKDWKAAIRTWERNDSQQKGDRYAGATNPYEGFTRI